MSVDYDIKQTRLVLSELCDVHNSLPDDNYARLYFSSNEDLKTVFSNFDFRDKDVLTVLASSDQLFHFFNMNAKSVETFDKNKLTIYYFYLRLWIIKYMKMYYPYPIINNSFIVSLLLNVCPSSEEEERAVEYWQKYVMTFNTMDTCELFMMPASPFYNIIENFSSVEQRLDDKIPEFYNIDLFQDVEVDSQYDVIYKSNISEYIKSEAELIRYRDNLYKMLRPGGMVISTNLMRSTITDEERSAFSEKFTYEEVSSDNNFKKVPGYVYYKK